MDFEMLKFGNAAGTIKTLPEVEEACKSAMTEITVGSITMEPREGNKPDRGRGRVYYYHPTEHWSLNSLGLPNMGLTEYIKVLPQMVLMAHSAGKSLRASVAGFTPEEYRILTEECYAAGVDEAELNFGCPNVWGEGGQKPIPSYDPALTESIYEEVDKHLAPLEKVAIKISPVTEQEILTPILDLAIMSGFVSRVVGTNTIPNQEGVAEDGSPALSFNGSNHLGGLAGAGIFYQALDVMEFVADYTNGSLDVMAVGGISSGKTAAQHLRSGASGFQCATAYLERGPRLFTHIIEELTELV